MRKKLDPEQSQKKRIRRLKIIKNGLECGHIKSFEELYSIMPQTDMYQNLSMGYGTLLQKSKDPRKFTYNDITYFAVLFGIKYKIMDDFVWNIIKAKSKSKIFQ